MCTTEVKQSRLIRSRDENLMMDFDSKIYSNFVTHCLSDPTFYFLSLQSSPKEIVQKNEQIKTKDTSYIFNYKPLFSYEDPPPKKMPLNTLKLLS